MLSSIITTLLFGITLGKDYGLSGKMVSTPLGYRPIECVKHADENAVLKFIDGVGTHVYYPDSGRREFHPEIKACVENIQDLIKERQEKKAKNNEQENVENLKTWEVYASETVSKMGTFTSQYQLPSDNPTTGKNIILYYFIGMQNNDNLDVTIIQPVIEYCDTCGANGGPGWDMSPWNCCESGQTWQGPIKVIPSSGAYINAVVMSNTTHDYISCENPSTGDKTALTVSDAKRTFNWISFTLEQYNVDDCNDYPSTPFWSREMKLADASGSSIDPSWTLQNGDGCGGSIKEQDAYDLALYSKTQ